MFRALCHLGALLGLVGSVFAQAQSKSSIPEFYSLDVFSDNLVRFSPQGIVTAVGPLGFDCVRADLTWHQDALYGVVQDSIGTWYVCQIETQGFAKGTAIGNFLKVGSSSGSAPTVVDGLASNGQTLYVTYGTNSPLTFNGEYSDRIGSVNPVSGVITPIGGQTPNADWAAFGGTGAPGPSPSGGFHLNATYIISYGGGLLGWANSSLTQVGPVGLYGLNQPVGDLSWHYATSTLYGMSEATAVQPWNALSVFTFPNITTTSEFFISGPFSGSKLDGLAQVPNQFSTIQQIPDQPFPKYYTIDVVGDRAYSFGPNGVATPLPNPLNRALSDADLASFSDAVYVLGQSQFGGPPHIYQLITKGAYAGMLLPGAPVTDSTGATVVAAEGFHRIGSTFQVSYGVTSAGLSNRRSFMGWNGIISSWSATPSGADFDASAFFSVGSWSLSRALDSSTNSTTVYDLFNSQWTTGGFGYPLNDLDHGWLDVFAPFDNIYLFMRSDVPGFVINVVGTSTTPVPLVGPGITGNSRFYGIARADQVIYK